MADGQITYAGQAVLLDVAEFQEWVDTWLPLTELHAVAAPLWSHNGRLDSKSGNPNPVGLPRPNHPPFPPAPQVKLNTLYWPTGATRWAFAFFVVDDAIKAALPDEGDLVLADGDPTKGGTLLETEMYMLTPRRITTTSGNNAWLIALVDERYWWQFKNVGNTEVLTSTTWDELYTLLADAIGGSGSAITNDSVSSDYLRPDPQELMRRFENTAAMLDAVAHSVGHRIIRKLDGNVFAHGWQSSLEQYDENTESEKALDSQIGGLEFTPPLPAELNVVFPKMREYRPYSERPLGIAEPIRTTVSVKTISLGGVADATKTVHSTCFALTSATTTDPILNESQLNALSLLIATDYANSLAVGYDLSFAGLVDWIPTGYDDHIEWTIGRLHPGTHGDYLVRTRVQSAPYNFGTEEQLSQQSTQYVLPEFGTGFLDDPLTQGGQATVSVYYYDDIDADAWVDTDVNIECFEHIMKIGSAAIAAGKKCYFNWDRNSNRWLITNVECP